MQNFLSRATAGRLAQTSVSVCALECVVEPEREGENNIEKTNA